MYAKIFYIVLGLASTTLVASAGHLRKTEREPVRRLSRSHSAWKYTDHLPRKVVHDMPTTCCGKESMASVKATINNIEDKVDHLKKIVSVSASLPGYTKDFWKGHVEHTEDAGLILTDGMGNQ